MLSSELVETTERGSKTNRLETLEYAKVEQNDLLVAEPGMVHFAGFSIGKSYKHTVRIVNKSSQNTRIHLFYPKSQHFKAKCSKIGNLAPGLADDIVIEFTPTAYQYYYDCIKVQNEAGNLLIPLHAYPVINKIDFPRNYDMGIHPLGEKTIRHVQLSCSVPMQFEFRIQITRPHSDFNIYPLFGIIPANGSIDIVIEFTPVKMACVRTEILLLVSQYGFQPFRCTIVGSSAPGATSKRQSQRIEEPAILFINDTGDARDEDEQVIDMSNQTSTLSPRQTLKTRREIKKTKQIVIEEEIQEGLKIPKDMEGLAASNFVLTQEPGKLKPRDLKKAITEQRELRQKQQEEQEELRKRTGGSSGSLSFEAIIAEESVIEHTTTRQLRELAYLQDLQEIDQAEKDLEFQSQKDRLGDIEMKPEEIDAVHQLREYVAECQIQKQRESARNTFETKSFGLYSTPPTRAEGPVDFVLESEADFDEYKNDLWAKRKRTVLRLTRAISRCIIRNRASKRLALIKKRLAGANTRAEVRKLVEQDWKYSQAPSGRSDIESMGLDVISTKLQRSTFPQFIETEEKTRRPEATDTPRHFHDRILFRLKIPNEADLLGYSEFTVPPVSRYMPLEKDRELRTGAQYERGIRAPRHLENHENPFLISNSISLFDTDQQGSFELLASQIPVEPMSLLIPSSEFRVLTQINSCRESDPDFILRPRIWQRMIERTRGMDLQESVGGISSGCIQKLPTISAIWRPTRVEKFTVVYSEGKQIGTWQVEDLPALLNGPNEQDELSESESDNEMESTITPPTFEEAKNLFVSIDPVAEPFIRYRQLIQAERTYNTQRTELSQRLPKRMQEMTACVMNSRHQFVLEGHGKEFPIHEL